MSCNCGHEHHHFGKKEFDEAVKRFMASVGKKIDLEDEYEKIQNKTSSLSRNQRDVIVAFVEYKREHFNE